MDSDVTRDPGQAVSTGPVGFGDRVVSISGRPRARLRSGRSFFGISILGRVSDRCWQYRTDLGPGSKSGTALVRVCDNLQCRSPQLAQEINR